MNSVLEKAVAAAKARPARVILPEVEDERIVEAAKRLASEGLAEPVALAEPSEALAEMLVEARGMKPAIAARMVNKPLIRAAAMVAAGEAEALIAGAVAPTRRVIEAAGLAIGLKDGIAAPSSFFLMVFPDERQMVFADCAVTVDPDAEALASIARASHASAMALLGEARLALLSYSTGTSGTGASVDKVAAAMAMLSDLAPRGPVQADAALNPGIAARKGAGDGDANTLIFPNLDAGNISYKLAQELASAQAVGTFLQGFRKPVCDLSRGASVDDIVAATLITLALG